MDSGGKTRLIKISFVKVNNKTAIFFDASGLHDLLSNKWGDTDNADKKIKRDILSDIANIIAIIEFIAALAGISLEAIGKKIYDIKDGAILSFFKDSFINKEYLFLISFFLMLIMVIINFTVIINSIKSLEKKISILYFTTSCIILYYGFRAIILNDLSEIDYIIHRIVWILGILFVVIYSMFLNEETRTKYGLYSSLAFINLFLYSFTTSYLYKDIKIPKSDFWKHLDFFNVIELKEKVLSINLQFLIILILIFLINMAALFSTYRLAKKGYFKIHMGITFIFLILIIVFYFQNKNLIGFV